MNTIEIRKMSVAERLQAMEALWESLVRDEAEVETPHWHEGVLAERKRQVESGEAEFMTIEELKARRHR